MHSSSPIEIQPHAGLRSEKYPLYLPRFWKGGESLPAQAGGGKSELHRARRRVTQVRTIGIHAGGPLQGGPTESATENKQPAQALPPGPVMVKRCGKSAPRAAQATRHGKPRRVQDQIGNPGTARSGAAKAAGFRVLVAETNDSLRRKAQTKIGLQPFQNQSQVSSGRGGGFSRARGG